LPLPKVGCTFSFEHEINVRPQTRAKAERLNWRREIWEAFMIVKI